MFYASLDAVNTAVAELAARAGSARELDDRALLAAQTAVADVTRQLGTIASQLAGEVVARSSVSAGHEGLAQKTGFRTPQALVKHVTGLSSRDATALVRVGSLLNDFFAASAAESADARSDAPGGAAGNTLGELMSEPWLVSVGEAITSGVLSVGAAEAIRSGIGTPNEAISADELAAVVEDLIDRVREAQDARSVATMLGQVAPALDPDTLHRWARDARDDLDAEGIRERERAQRQARSLRRWRKPDGMTQYTWLLPPDDAAIVDGVYDQLTSPRRGGPRFTRDDEVMRAENILRDERTTEQLASDGFLEVLRHGAHANPSQLLGTRQPAVRVLVSENALAQRTGHGRIEGHPDPISIESVERHACSSGTVAITLDTHGQPIDVGREQRLFTHRQRIALAARDGGCMAPGCDRPPSWTEAHHIQHWKRDEGRTDIDNGILLCRHHHLLFHDHGWDISRRGGDYWLTPPASIDPHRTPIRMPSKSAALRDHQREDQREQQRAEQRHRPQHARAS